MAEIVASIDGVQRPTTQWFASVESVVRDVLELTAGVDGVVRTVWAAGGGGWAVEISSLGEEEWLDGYTPVVFLVNADIQIEMRRMVLTWSGEATGYAQEFSYYESNWFRVEGDDEHVYEVTWWDMPWVVVTKYQIVG